MRRWLRVFLAVAAAFLIPAVTTIGALIGLNAECNGGDCPRSDAWRAGVIAMPVTAAILLLVGATWSVVSRKLRPLVLAEATVLSVVCSGRRRRVRARPWHGSAARGSGVRRLACATPLTQRLTFAVAEVDGLFVAEDDRADRRVVADHAGTTEPSSGRLAHLPLGLPLFTTTSANASQATAGRNHQYQR